MNGKSAESILARRLFLTRLGTGISVVGAVAAGTPAVAAQSAGNGRWEPVRHEQDDWLDKIPGKHRFVFDTTSPEGLASALQYANNYFEANKNSYGLPDSDQAVVVVLRHKSTAFAYNDAIWAKYSAPLSVQANNFLDPRTKVAPVVNVYGTPGVPAAPGVPEAPVAVATPAGDAPGGGGRGGGTGGGGRLDGLIKRGVHMAVCQMATRAIAGSLARATGGNTDTIFAELAANLLTNARLVPAGIVAVNRAQERGYALHVG